MSAAVVHVEVHTGAPGALDVAWVLDGGPAAVDVAVGSTPEHIDHAHHLTVPAGVTTAVVPGSPDGRTYVSVVLHDGGPAVVAADRRVPFVGITNFRDLGGYPTADGGRTRWGHVFRADVLHFLSPDDVELYESLGMQAVFDLRGETERESHPNRVPTTWMELLSRPVAEAAMPRAAEDDGPITADDGERILRTIYAGMVEHSASTIGSLLTALLTNGDARGFHCHAGKDRTGVVAAVLLLALGVDRELVLDDYELTARYRLRSQQDASFERMIENGLPPEAAAAVLTTPRWAMEEALDVIDAEHGGIDSWLTTAAGMSAEAVAALRARLASAPSSGGTPT